MVLGKLIQLKLEIKFDSLSHGSGVIYKCNELYKGGKWNTGSMFLDPCKFATNGPHHFTSTNSHRLMCQHFWNWYQLLDGQRNNLTLYGSSVQMIDKWAIIRGQYYLSIVIMVNELPCARCQDKFHSPEN